MSRFCLFFSIALAALQCGCWEAQSYEKTGDYGKYLNTAPPELVDFFPSSHRHLLEVRYVDGAQQGENRLQCLLSLGSSDILDELERLPALSVKTGFDENDPSTFQNGARKPRIVLDKNKPRFPLPRETVVTLRHSNISSSGFLVDDKKSYVIFWACWE